LCYFLKIDKNRERREVILKKAVVKQINWYLDFAQRDLEALPKGDAAKLIFEARDLVSRGLTGVKMTEVEKLQLLGVLDGLEQSYNLTWLQQLQRSFLSVFEPMMSRIERLSERLEPGWKTYSDSNMIDGVSIAEPLQVSFRAEVKVLGPLEFDHGGEKIKVRPSPDWIEDSTITMETQPDIDNENLFIYGFVKCLPGIATGAFRRCEECQKWFLHLSKRKREFCSNPCAARSGNRTRRAKQKAEDPEKHATELEKSRKRASKSYETKIKKIHPKAQIQRYRKRKGESATGRR